MTYSVYQHWDPLKVCIVGRSYTPEFYSFIANSRTRTVMERIAHETEEDYQNLIKLLESFGVEVMRPVVHDNYEHYLSDEGKIYPPPMTPCDWSIMVGDTFYHNWISELQVYNDIKDSSWPNITSLEEYVTVDNFMKQEVNDAVRSTAYLNFNDYKHVIDKILNNNNTVADRALKNGSSILNRSQITRVGRDLYIGTDTVNDRTVSMQVAELFPEYRTHIVDTNGHSDGTYCPVVPGLIVSLRDIPTYKDTFPDWEVVYLPGQSWSKIKPFLQLKEKNAGKWWVPGEELNDDFTDFVESWLDHWVGYVEETVFDVNMLVIDEKNVVVNNYNEQVFRAFDRYGITPHVVNFRHRYFWDGGLHCITSDVHREGTMKDYFPERG